MKTTKKAGILGLLLAVITIGSVSALDFGKFNDSIQPGSFLISGSFGLGRFNSGMFTDTTDDSTLLGGDLAVDYALPFAALTIGVSVGFSGGSEKISSSDDSFYYFGPDLNFTLGEIPIIARIGYHPDFGVKNLDIYVLGKIGYGIGFWSGDDKDVFTELENPAGLIWGFDIGVRYFVTPAFGIFVEGGYEYSEQEYKINHSDNEYSWRIWNTYYERFLSVGVTLKVGK